MTYENCRRLTNFCIGALLAIALGAVVLGTLIALIRENPS